MTSTAIDTQTSAELFTALQHLINRIDDNPRVHAAVLEDMPQAIEDARNLLSRVSSTF